MTAIQNSHADEQAFATATTLEVTILLPCRNEERTVGICAQNALGWLASRQLRGEVLVVDNASTDASAAIASAAGARVIFEPTIGYGNALRTGIRASRGHVVIMADADNTYDLSNLDAFYAPIAIAVSHDMVVGDRFAGSLEPGAMTRLHRVGNWALSALTRRATGCKVRDVHCGLRSFTRASMQDLPTWSTGMEFATHTVTHAHHNALRVLQTPIALRPAVDQRKSHLRPLRDGVRHLVAIARQTRN